MDERQHVTKSLTDPSACGWETPRRGQRVLASFTCWARQKGPLQDAPQIDAARNKAPPLCKVEQEVITVDAPPPPRPPFHDDADGLDEWLLIPRPSVFHKPDYIKAVDDALLKCKDGERIIYETVDGFVVDVEVHEILAEKDLIQSTAGFTRTQRLRATKSQVVRPPSSGCVVRGTLKVLQGSLPSRSWFGLGEDDAFSAKIGDGLLSEGFVACLTDIKQGSSAKCTISGECLLPDLCSGEEQHAIVPAAYWAGAQTEACADVPSVVLEVSVASVDDSGKKSRDPMSMTLAEKDERSKVLKERGTALYKARRFRRAERVWRRAEIKFRAPHAID